MSHEDDDLDRGPCCACEKRGPTVREVFRLHKRAPVPGHGWGCLFCGLPSDGASYVLCDECVGKQAPPRFACRGYPAIDGRIPIEELTEDFKHDFSLHTLDCNAYDSMIDIPENWWFYALQCRLVAGTLRSECIRIVAPLLPGINAALTGQQITNEMRGDCNFFSLEAHQAFAEQLVGCALENAFKAAIVSRKPRPPGKQGTLRDDLNSHVLVTLAQRAGINVNARRRKKLEHLTNMVVWQSRYPVAMKAEKTGTISEIDLDETFAIVKEIMIEVKEMLKQDGRNVLSHEFKDSGLDWI